MSRNCRKSRNAIAGREQVRENEKTIRTVTAALFWPVKARPLRVASLMAQNPPLPGGPPPDPKKKPGGPPPMSRKPADDDIIEEVELVEELDDGRTLDPLEGAPSTIARASSPP